MDWNDNILFPNILKLIEMYVETEKYLELLEDTILETDVDLNLDYSIENREGIGIVEAPRGTLRRIKSIYCHWNKYPSHSPGAHGFFQRFIWKDRGHRVNRKESANDY